MKSTKPNFMSLCLLSLIFSACNPGATPNSETHSVVINGAGTKWSAASAIPVCFTNRTEISSEIIEDIKNYVSNEYASKTAIRFIGWGDCTPGDLTSKVVRVQFRRIWDWSNRSATAGGGVSRLGASSTACNDACGQGTMRLDIGLSGAYPTTGLRDFAITQTRGAAVHEFGHAIGLAHEHERVDAPQCENYDTKIQEGQAYAYVGAFDPLSIMNYCRNRNISTLTSGDVAGINFLYPSGAAKAIVPVARTLSSFQAAYLGSYYLRHQNFVGALTPITNDLDRQDGSFRVVAGLSDPNAISFESKNFPGYYLRHQNYEVRLMQKDGSKLFNDDATFYPRQGLGFGVSFESLNYPGLYIRHQNFLVYLQRPDGSTLFNQDASFNITGPLAP